MKKLEIGGFETQRSVKNAKALALTGHAAHGCAGSAETGVEGADREVRDWNPKSALPD